VEQPGSLSRQVSILIGTDDIRHDLAELAEGALEAHGLELRIVSKSKELIAEAQSLRPAVILLAYGGMERDGFLLCRQLQQLEGQPLIAVAARPDPAAISAAVAAGAIDVFPTPIQWDLLGHRLQRLAESRELTAELDRVRTSLENTQRIARIGSWEWNRDSEQMNWSEQTFTILGLNRNQVHTDFESFSMCMHPDDRAGVLTIIDEALQAGRAFSAPYRIVQSTGSVRHVQLCGELSEPNQTQICGTLQDITIQRRAEERIRYLAHHDSLTGLTNRTRFRELLEKSIQAAKQKGHSLALLYMDLDQFKRINDTLGHGAGDRLLQEIAETLIDNLRGGDVVSRDLKLQEAEVSRLGGDEFAVLLTKVSDPDDAGLVARRILEALPTPVKSELGNITTTISIGIALYPADGEDAETLVKHADTAMYHAKEAGRNNYKFFSAAMNESALRRFAIETGLREALERDEMAVRFQPRVCIDTGRIECFEALLRWKHREMGWVTPHEFIPVAEDTGLIVEIGDWVMRAACDQGRIFAEAGHPVTVSVNVSTSQFSHSGLQERIASTLRDSGHDPRRLEIEITETAMMQDDEQTIGLLHDLQRMGIRISLDDFGTGYSSLSYLTRFPLDTIKLDRSLVQNIATNSGALAVARAAIAMAGALELRVVAEGVEAVDQVRCLQEAGCDEIQGFLIADALTPEKCLQLLAAPPVSLLTGDSGTRPIDEASD